MIILGIDTSCDDTAIAIIEARGKKSPEFKILSNVVSSQVKIHRQYGGVYPLLAKREHQKNLPLVLKKALKKVKERSSFKIDLIAVTIGPGLEPCLWQGINFAKKLAHNWKKPIVPVNHLEGHILANLLPSMRIKREPSRTEINKKRSKIKNLFPALSLIVSGGHTQLILIKEIGKYQLLGETRDDAAGECFDKTARILGLGYPGGPAIADMAARLKIKDLRFKIKLPRPMIYSKDYDFSFSGLKTAVLYDYRKRPKKVRTSKEYKKLMAAEIQQAIIDVLVKKTIRAAKDFRVKSIILGGGVAANDELRRHFKHKIKDLAFKVNFLVPPKNLCTDNAAMIAVAGYCQWLRAKTRKEEEIKAQANMKIT